MTISIQDNFGEKVLTSTNHDTHYQARKTLNNRWMLSIKTHQVEIITFTESIDQVKAFLRLNK